MKTIPILITFLIIGLVIASCTRQAVNEAQKPKEMARNNNSVSSESTTSAGAAKSPVSDSDLNIEQGAPETSDSDLPAPTQDTG